MELVRTAPPQTPKDGEASISEVWSRLQSEAQVAMSKEPILGSLLASTVLAHDTLGAALSFQLARRVGDQETRAVSLRDVMRSAYADAPQIVAAAALDLLAILERDPASRGVLKPFMFYKGFLALQIHRIAHWLYHQGRPTLASHIQSRNSEICHVDIHPGARIGQGVFIDHGTGVVMGETVVVADDVSILQGVTLGGSGASPGDRHPKIGRGVLLSAGSKVLGPVTVGENAKIAAGSVVLIDVPPACTAVGNPARLVNCPSCDTPARSMDQTVPDIV